MGDPEMQRKKRDMAGHQKGRGNRGFPNISISPASTIHPFPIPSSPLPLPSLTMATLNNRKQTASKTKPAAPVAVEDDVQKFHVPDLTVKDLLSAIPYAQHRLLVSDHPNALP